ncbi:MAG TPA: hypothetical protein VGY13_08170 [Solirubrobacteraceae bacterium]|jgi:hypothetical protein|nr:hypothetical protein [Solirubrobacteraceae bacterium]
MVSSPPYRGKALQQRTAGIVVVIVGGLVFVGALSLLDWAELPKVMSAGGTIRIVSHDAALWHFKGNLAGVLTVIAAGTVAFAAMGLLSDSTITALPAVCGSFYLLGRTFPVGDGYSGYRAGFWLATATALAMSIGSVIAVAGATSLANRVARPS